MAEVAPAVRARVGVRAVRRRVPPRRHSSRAPHALCKRGLRAARPTLGGMRAAPDVRQVRRLRRHDASPRLPGERLPEGSIARQGGGGKFCGRTTVNVGHRRFFI